MDADDIARIYAGVVGGGTKEQYLAAYEGREGFDHDAAAAKWDEIAASVAATKAKHPDAQFDIPT